MALIVFFMFNCYSWSVCVFTCNFLYFFGDA